jgi:hypothetical protein
MVECLDRQKKQLTEMLSRLVHSKLKLEQQAAPNKIQNQFKLKAIEDYTNMAIKMENARHNRLMASKDHYFGTYRNGMLFRKQVDIDNYYRLTGELNENREDITRWDQRLAALQAKSRNNLLQNFKRLQGTTSAVTNFSLSDEILDSEFREIFTLFYIWHVFPKAPAADEAVSPIYEDEFGDKWQLRIEVTKDQKFFRIYMKREPRCKCLSPRFTWGTLRLILRPDHSVNHFDTFNNIACYFSYDDFGTTFDRQHNEYLIEEISIDALKRVTNIQDRPLTIFVPTVKYNNFKFRDYY